MLPTKELLPAPPDSEAVSWGPTAVAWTDSKLLAVMLAPEGSVSAALVGVALKVPPAASVSRALSLPVPPLARTVVKPLAVRL